jgi:lysozyme family protein
MTAGLAYPEKFLRAVARVLEDEGGYANLASDPGGETKFGISRRDYPGVDIRDLTREEAVAIYFRDFWSRGRYAELPGQIAEKVFDLAVNIGPRAGAQCLQRALRACGHRVAEDGVIGDATIAAAHAAVRGALLASLRSEAAGHYRMTAATWHRAGRSADFLEGWLKRAYE